MVNINHLSLSCATSIHFVLALLSHKTLPRPPGHPQSAHYAVPPPGYYSAHHPVASLASLSTQATGTSGPSVGAPSAIGSAPGEEDEYSSFAYCLCLLSYWLLAVCVSGCCK